MPHILYSHTICIVRLLPNTLLSPLLAVHCNGLSQRRQQEKFTPFSSLSARRSTPVHSCRARFARDGRFESEFGTHMFYSIYLPIPPHWRAVCSTHVARMNWHFQRVFYMWFDDEGLHFKGAREGSKRCGMVVKKRDHVLSVVFFLPLQEHV